jgi:pilus assembly protein CpaB
MNRSLRTLIVLLVALTAAGVASFAVYRAVSNVPVKQVEVATVHLLVAARPLSVGTLLSKDDVRVVGWPAASPVPGGLTKPEEAIGRGLLQSVSENEPITASKVALPEAGAGLPPTIPVGMRAISVRVNDVISVAGFVVPGTRVDVLASINQGQEAMARTVVSNVQVLAAGTRFDQQEAKDGKPIPTTVVTLLATPPDAEKIALAANDGKIMLVLRNPMDKDPTVTPGVRLASLMAPPSPPPVERVVQGRKVVRAVAPPPPPPAPKVYTVETIRGAKRSEEVVR